ncbi:MAG: O-antigen ligase family protein [Prevotella sp.]|nr:O-antigen ligase family protein [Prevotella sp.]
MNFALLYVFQRVLYDVKDIRLFLKAMIGVAVLITLLGIYESIFHDNPVLDYVYYNSPQEGTEGRMYYLPPGVGQGFHIRFGMVRAYSFFGIHIAFGCACVFILGLLLFIIKKKFFIGMNKKLFYFAMLLLIIGCITSNSKTSYLGLAVMLLMIFDTKKILNMRVLFLVGVLFLVFYNFFPNYFDNIYSLFDEEIASEGGGSTIDVRERQFEVALSMFKQNPILGNGPGSISVLKAFGDNSDILGAEGALLTILPERGAIGYAVYLFTFIYFFFTNRKIIPTFELFIFLLSLFAMEVVSGLRDMTLYYCLLLAMRRICLIKKVSM